MSCRGPWRRFREHLWLPIEEYGEFPGTADKIRKKLATTDPDVASALLDEAEKLAAEPHDRAEGAERRATTLQGAVAIAASFGIASSALLLDSNKIKSEGWRQTFAILAFGFIFCLVAAGFRAVSAVYRVHRWSYADGSEIFDRAKMDECNAKTARAAALLRTVARNQAIARWKVAYMRAAAWWFRIALVFLLAAAAVLVLYAFLGSRIPHISIPWTRSARADHFYERYLLLALVPLLLGWFVFSRRRSRRSGSTTATDQRSMVVLLVLGFAGALLIEWLVPNWRIHLVPLRHAGLAVALIAASWISWTYRELGLSYSGSTAPATEHRLRSDGPYALVRHPMYLGMVVLSLAPSLIYSPGFSVVTLALLVVSYQAASREEKALLRHDRAAYEAYSACVPDRVLPGDRLALR